MPEALGDHYVDIDERSEEDLLLFTRKFAELVRFYPVDSSISTSDWSRFFPANADEIRRLLNTGNGDTPPHLALFRSFLQLYLAGPQESINRFTSRHLDFYFKEVLRLSQRPALPYKAHVLVELKKKMSPICLTPLTLFSAGPDATKTELLYRPTGETVINTARVASVRSVYHDPKGRGTIRCAPIANSSDGIGGKPTGSELLWPAFGSEDHPKAEIGFAIASPLLVMKEGNRSISLILTLGNLNRDIITEARIKNIFELYLTGEKGWMGPFETEPALVGNNKLKFSFTVPASEKAIAGYQTSLHGYRYTTDAPVVQVLLKHENTAPGCGYDDLAGLKIKKVQVTVGATGITALSPENDLGLLNPKKPFAPFGPQPTKGAVFLVGCPEALTKKLTELSLEVDWKNPPRNFANYYTGYRSQVKKEVMTAADRAITNNMFTADVDFGFGEGRQYAEEGVRLFESDDARLHHVFSFATEDTPATGVLPPRRKAAYLERSGTGWSKKQLREWAVSKPVLVNHPDRTDTPPGFIRFTLNNDFLHSEYPKKTTENILAFAKQPDTTPAFKSLNEPYTPVVQAISLNYKASSDEINISSNSLDDFANGQIQFFQVASFGQVQEHTYQRGHFDFLTDKSVSLLPEYPSEGELLIGFESLYPGDSVSLLFQAAEGSEDPGLPRADIEWSVLCDNYWKPLTDGGVALDTTNRLLRSGIVKLVIPHDATTVNTLLPSDLVWVKASVRQYVKAVCRMTDLVANAVEVQLDDRGNDPGHLAKPLEKNKITKLKESNASIKSISQPYASFGGRQAETDESLYTRCAERLRHKNRCITVWDYERIVLHEFPGIHKVKCIPHAKLLSDHKQCCWMAPGNILLVAVPDLTNKNAVDPLAPKVSADTLARIVKVVSERSGPQIKVGAKNPSYQKIRLEFKVKFREGYEFNFYSEKLKEQIKRFLSPWAYSAGRDLTFGGKIYKSTLLHVVEEVEWVDYLEDFYLYTVDESSRQSGDLNVAEPATPDAILVSDHTHLIHEITNGHAH